MKKFLRISFLLRLGLAAAFLANSITAFGSPDEFKELVSGSFLAGILPVSVASFVVFIGVSDLLVAILLLIGKKVSWVAFYASLWIIGVMFVGGIMSTDAIEHIAFLCLAVAVALHGRDE
ncbi:MAG: hypothetical protein PHS53_02470 [Candidatus Pacebacteria bacterium]|nr:hypothetical protein [Candidatus Paceibacterota bacterium]MDD5356988.1 hypothetical protein [Candidatus Paceibacterota bacterium]